MDHDHGGGHDNSNRPLSALPAMPGPSSRMVHDSEPHPTLAGIVYWDLPFKKLNLRLIGWPVRLSVHILSDSTVSHDSLRLWLA